MSDAELEGRMMASMHAMTLRAPRTPLVMQTRSVPVPGAGEILVAVAVCGVCRTDLHVVDGELQDPKLPIVPGHEIVGRVAALGMGVSGFSVGERVGVPWLGATCGTCAYCRAAAENLCDAPIFTGYTRDGGYATHAVADAHEFLNIAPKAGVKCEVTRYPLARANEALSDLREGRLQGAATLIP